MSDEPVTDNRGRRQVRVGRVVGNKMDKTVVVAVDKIVLHPLYRRRMKKTTRLYAHDEGNLCGIGDEVSIVSCRPLSRLKRWRVREVLKKAVGS